MKTLTVLFAIGLAAAGMTGAGQSCPEKKAASCCSAGQGACCPGHQTPSNGVDTCGFCQACPAMTAAGVQLFQPDKAPLPAAQLVIETQAGLSASPFRPPIA